MIAANSYQFKKDFNEFDPAKKKGAQGMEWANRLLTQFRLSMSPLADPVRAAINRSYLLGEQSIEKYKKKFATPKKGEELPFDIRPLGIFEKMRNILTAERQKAGIYIQTDATDPTAQTEKDMDKKLLVNAQFIEEMLTYAQTSIGLPPYQLASDKNLDGTKLTNGNIEAFKELSLDPNSPEDVAYFFKTHYRLDTEIAAEDVVNFFVRMNELEEYISEWCDDIIAVKAAAARVYCDEQTCLPRYKYLKPEAVRWIKGARRDGKDAKAVMTEENMTVADFLSYVGTEITQENVLWIVESVNYSNATTFNGLRNGSILMPEGCNNPCSYDNFLSMKINVCYIEWKSIDVDTMKVGRNTLGNMKMWDMPYEWKPKEDNGSYKKEQIWNVVTYKTYAIYRTSTTQALFKFGRLFDQVTYGPEDEYSNFSFQMYQQNGQSAIDIAIPFIDVFHDAWFRFNWILNKAKPRGTRYNYNVIAKIASKMYKTDPEENGVLKVIAMFQQSIDDFYVNDSLNPNVGGGQNPHFDKENGLDKSVKELYDICQQQQELLSEKLGINAMREAYSPNPNDGYKLQMQSLAQSRNATEYMSRMIMSLLINFGKHTMAIVQDMVSYKGRGYTAIEKAVGFQALDRIAALKKVPLHKFGIFVQSFNTDLDRQEQKKEALDAWMKGEIPYHVYLLVKSINNYKKAAQVLAYEKAKDIQRKQDEQLQIHQQKMDEIKAQTAGKMAIIDAQTKGDIAHQEVTNAGLIEVARINNDADYKIKELSINAEPMKAGVRAGAKIRTDEAAHRIKKGEPAEETSDI